MPTKKEALWPFKKGLPKKFKVPQRCLCDTYGMACADGPPVVFEKSSGGKWKVNGQESPLTDQEAVLLLKRCEVTTAKTRTAQQNRDKVLRAVITTLRKIDWGQPVEGQLPKLEKASDALTRIGIKPVDVDLAIASWTKGKVEEAKNFINGPSGRGTNKGALADLMSFLEKKKTGAPTAPNPSQIAQKVLNSKAFKKLMTAAENNDELATAVLEGLGEVAAALGAELLDNDKYVQTVLTEVLKQLEK